jgi:hypothetical protein
MRPPTPWPPAWNGSAGCWAEQVGTGAWSHSDRAHGIRLFPCWAVSYNFGQLRVWNFRARPQGAARIEIFILSRFFRFRLFSTGAARTWQSR